jgi:hypothetical protein
VTDAERIYQLMVLTARADDTVDPRESRVMAEIVTDTPELHDLGERAALTRAARGLLESKGLIAAVREVAMPIVEPDARLLAVRCCARVLAADGVVAGAELEVMGQLRRCFGYTVEDIEDILMDPHP